MMLMTIGGLLTATILMSVAIWKRLKWLKILVAGGVVTWFSLYFVALIAFSLNSREKVLSLNEPKAYCGFYLDCHLHTEITGVRFVKTIGNQSAQGIFVIVNVRVFSDARNPNIVLRLLEPKAQIEDKGGQMFARNREAEGQLPTSGVQLGQDISGSGMIEKEIVFDVNGNREDLRLLITEGQTIDRIIEAFLIDDEDSLLHKKVVFKIDAPGIQ